MKISKLFHVLYASLMLAPIFAIGGSMAFNIINDKSVDNAQVEDIEAYNKVAYETNEINSVSDFVNGNVYRYYIRNLDEESMFAFGQDFIIDVPVLAFYLPIPSTDIGIDDFQFTNIDYLISPRVTFFQRRDDLFSFFFMLSSTDFDNYVAMYYAPDYSSLINGYPFYIDFLYDTNYESLTIEPDVDNEEYLGTFIVPCPDTYYHYEEVVISRPQDLSDNFYFALEDMANSPYFSWASSGFLVQPFAYIFGLFGVPLNSPIMILLSYWLTISIIWLVFDLTMYVPLLVHSWIDKGVIE